MVYINHIPIKVSFIGFTYSGKTSLIYAITGKTVELYYLPTIGLDLELKTIKNYKLQLWDISGQIRFRVFTSSYVSSADIIVLCFSAEDKNSFYQAIDLYNYYLNKDINKNKFILVITKTKSSNKVSSYSDWIDESTLSYIKYIVETDAITNYGIESLTNTIINLYKSMNISIVEENYKKNKPKDDSSCTQIFGYEFCNIL